ncbi:MAG: hypothetical protein ABII01_04670 [Candidatus Woesearchaeota archaeon]
MLPEVKKYIEDSIHIIIKAVRESDVLRLRKLSNVAIRNASVYQDEDSVSFAVITYSLSKIIERNRDGSSREYKKFIENTILFLRRMRSALEKKDFKSYRIILDRIFSAIEKIDDKLASYIQEVVEKSKIKKGSTFYDQGISIARSAEVLGISQWSLMNYVGQTKIIDSSYTEGIPIKKRLKLVREIFDLQ